VLCCADQELVLALLKQAIERNLATSKGFLIDGYPRELHQGTRFEAEVAPVERVLYFQVHLLSLLTSCNAQNQWRKSRGTRSPIIYSAGTTMQMPPRLRKFVYDYLSVLQVVTMIL